jgi:hypothetical protein
MKNKWYQSFYFTQEFPLKPKIYKVEPSEYNIRIYKFRWLFFIFELNKNFHFNIAIHASTYSGIGITLDIPYVRLGFCIELPNKVNVWIWNNLERNTKFRKKQLEIESKMTSEEKRQNEINKAIKHIEGEIKDTRTEIKYYNEDKNFCPYKVADLTIRLNKSIEYLNIIKTLE